MLAQKKILKETYTEKALGELENRAVTLALIEVAVELGISPEKMPKYKYSKGELLNFIKIKIRDMVSNYELLSKRIAKLQKQRDKDYQLVLDFMERK